MIVFLLAYTSYGAVGVEWPSISLLSSMVLPDMTCVFRSIVNAMALAVFLAPAAYGAAVSATGEEARLRRDVMVIERTKGPDSPALIAPLNQLTELLWTKGDLDGALALFRRSVDIRVAGKADMGEHQIVTFLRRSHAQAELLMKDARYRQAIALMECEQEILDRLDGRNNRYIVNLQILADLYIAVDSHEAAQKSLLLALDIAKTVEGDNRRTAQIFGKLGEVAQIQGQLQDAERWYRKALELSRQANGPESRETMGALSDLGQFLVTLGRMDEAEQCLRDAMAIRASLGESDDDATILANLGVLLDSRGNLSEAEPLLDKALAIRQRTLPAHHPDIAHTRSYLAGLYGHQTRWNDADNSYRLALADLPPRSMDYARSLNGHAIVLSRLARTSEAEAAYLRSLEIRESLHGPENHTLAPVLRNLATLYDDMGQTARATPLYERSLHIDEVNFGRESPALFDALAVLASHYLGQDRDAEAAGLTRRAIAIVLNSPGNAHDYSILHTAAIAERRAMRMQTAILFGKMAVNSIQGLRGRSNLVDAEQVKQFMLDKGEVYRLLARLLAEAGRIDEAQQVLAMLKEEEYFEFLHRDAGQDDPRATRASLTPAEAEALRRLREAAGSKRDLAETLDDVTATLVVRGKGDAADALSTRVQASAALAEQWQDMFRDNGVLLQYLVSEDALVIFVSTAQEGFARTVPISAVQVRTKVLAYRQALLDPQQDPVPPARALYDLLLAPVAGDLERLNAKLLVVSLDDVLRYLPIAALHDGKNWLAEHYPVAVLAQASVANLRTQPHASWKVAAFGTTQGGEGLKPLPAVKDELTGIVKTDQSQGVLPGVIALDELFTGEAVRQAVAQHYQALHFATHFVFRPGDDSYLLLGNGNRISLRDIHRRLYSFADVEFLALSACETGKIGKDANGREVEGLGVAVQQRGAHSVLASLWPVADVSTAVLMRRFYQLRENTPGISKAEALRQAQLWLINGQPLDKVESDMVQRGALPSRPGISAAADTPYVADPNRPFAHPNFWAPFILMGNWL